MRGAKRSAKNTAKNISLLVLCGLMGVLCAVNWLMGLNIAQMPADSALRRLHDRFVGGAVGYEIRSSGVSAADPAQMALTVDGKLYGVQYNLTDIDAGITATRSLWSQALTGEGLRQADESELCTALRSGSCALLRYHGAIPMQSIAGWLGGSWKDNARLQVETLVYAAGVQRLFVRMADGRLYAADAAVSQNALEEAQKNFRGLSCQLCGRCVCGLSGNAAVRQRGAVASGAETGADQPVCRTERHRTGGFARCIRLYGLHGFLQRAGRNCSRVPR